MPVDHARRREGLAQRRCLASADYLAAVKYQRTLFEPEHDLFRESYRSFLERHVAPYHDEWEKAKYFPDEVFKTVKALSPSVRDR